MRRFVDFHTHSTFSDGQLTPAELVRHAESHRLAAIALTDHDTTDGITEARASAREFPSLQFVAGLEVSAKYDGGTLHILGLGIDEGNAQLQSTLKKLREARDERNPKIIAALRNLGIDITMEEVKATAAAFDPQHTHKVVGRMHIALTLCRKRIVKNTEEAFRRYIGHSAPAFVDKEKMMPAEAIEAIRAAGGVAALAHPPQLNCENYAQLERVLRSLVRAGLNGLEVYHSEHSPEQTRHYLDLAKKHKLAVTGGSDFHGKSKQNVYLGSPRVPMASLTGELGRMLKINAAG